MADEADIAGAHEERNIAQCIRTNRKPLGPVPNGRCHWCDEIVPDEARFCDTDCRDDWQREQNLLLNGGRPSD